MDELLFTTPYYALLYLVFPLIFVALLLRYVREHAIRTLKNSFFELHLRAKQDKTFKESVSFKIYDEILRFYLEQPIGAWQLTRQSKKAQKTMTLEQSSQVEGIVNKLKAERSSFSPEVQESIDKALYGLVMSIMSHTFSYQKFKKKEKSIETDQTVSDRQLLLFSRQFLPLNKYIAFGL
ncbi:hypothetical protein ACQZV8_12675 [Magnetococcales bacterium HHB-1]